MNDMDVVECWTCGRKLIYVKTDRGHVIPIIRSPVGNIFLHRGVAVYVSHKKAPPKNASLYLVHSTICFGPIKQGATQ